MDYALPRSDDVPPVAIDHLDTPSPLNPLGVKGVGESGSLPVAAVRRVGGRGRADRLWYPRGGNASHGRRAPSTAVAVSLVREGSFTTRLTSRRCA